MLALYRFVIYFRFLEIQHKSICRRLVGKDIRRIKIETIKNPDGILLISKSKIIQHCHAKPLEHKRSTIL